jgi:hypothetical protein
VKSTLERAKLAIRREGGKVTDQEVVIPFQAPQSLKLEQFAPGRVVERIAIADPRWKWQGGWDKVGNEHPEKRSKTAGAEATVTFEGTGAMLVGSLDTDRGTADLYLDGKLMEKIDGYNDDGDRGSEGLWGKFDLKPGTHTVRVVVKGQPYPGSKGAWQNLEDLIVYQQ